MRRKQKMFIVDYTDAETSAWDLDAKVTLQEIRDSFVDASVVHVASRLRLGESFTYGPYTIKRV